ncbi:MAG: hypothetical protein Q9217_002137 [Psora testacea]
MAPTPSSSPRHLNTRGRSIRKPHHRASSVESPSTAEPPSKKRKYAPGGPGGGGRYVTADGQEVLVGGGGPGGYYCTGARGKPSRQDAANAIQPDPSPRPRRETRSERMPARPRFSSAAAAAAAVVHGDGFKPREERGWEEFHQDLDTEVRLPVFSAQEVDGIKKPSPTASLETTDFGRQAIINNQANSVTPTNGNGKQTPSAHDQAYKSTSPRAGGITPKRRPGRPPRRADSMLKGIGMSPDTPKIVPPPGFNPREKLTLPKPSFHPIDPFAKYEDREEFVDQAMSHVGYQEGELWARPGTLIRVTEGNIEDDLVPKSNKPKDKDDGTGIGPSGVGRVEYDMDEQDMYWLQAYNEMRKEDDMPEIKPWVFEVTMTKIEKEWHALEKRIPKPNPKPPQTHRPRSSSAAAVNGELAAPGEEQDSKCAICDDGDCENTNAIVFCDGCDLAVHQECYGVPFIPEGQWLCRKCQLIGRGTPTCIFCPNTDGAFKQTNASRWSHLLCAIWIPEVSIGNATFMEPVMDVEKVPKQRWKLTCYICRQKMGACIQCGNKNCYIAFHVTCARRARLFLKMKSTHGGPASLDASVLKAFCDKHVPTDWRREHDVDRAIMDAMEHYRYTMRGRLWADSQQAALTMMPPPPQDPLMEQAACEEPSNPKITLKLGTKTVSRPQPPKIVWKLPSGAPVIPQALYSSIESSLQRFMIQKRRGFAAEMCKYWTLKREARRGAALLKRLQLQMETFTSMEIPRRNFAGMGAAGGVRLQRRIDFAGTLLEDVERLRQLCAKVVEREQQKLEDAKVLQEVLDTVYFPITPMLSPILQKAQILDSKGIFAKGFSEIGKKINERLYPTVLEFSKDFGAIVKELICSSSATDPTDSQLQTNGETPTKSKIHPEKTKKALAKRIIRAVQGPLEDAVRRESQLFRQPYESKLQKLQSLLQDSLSSRRNVILGNGVDNSTGGYGEAQPNSLTNGEAFHQREQDAQTHSLDSAMPQISHKSRSSAKGGARSRRTNGFNEDEQIVNGALSASSSSGKVLGSSAADSVSSSSSDSRRPSTVGGVPWYMENFKPEGTTIEEEQWTGRDLVRDLSEDLSDMDEEEMSGLINADSHNRIPNGEPDKEIAVVAAVAAAAAAAAAAAKRRKAATIKRKRARNYR